MINKVKRSKKNSKLIKAFGKNEYGFVNLSGKLGSRKVSRVLNYIKMGGCPFCFPHGFETINNKYKKNREPGKYIEKNNGNKLQIIIVNIP